MVACYHPDYWETDPKWNKKDNCNVLEDGLNVGGNIYDFVIKLAWAEMGQAK